MFYYAVNVHLWSVMRNCPYSKKGYFYDIFDVVEWNSQRVDVVQWICKALLLQSCLFWDLFSVFPLTIPGFQRFPSHPACSNYKTSSKTQLVPEVSYKGRNLNEPKINPGHKGWKSFSKGHSFFCIFEYSGKNDGQAFWANLRSVSSPVPSQATQNLAVSWCNLVTI